MKILAVMAHPDYHVLWLGGTLAKHVGKGDKCYVVSISGGERGAPTEIPIDAKRWTEEFGRSKTSGAREGAEILGIEDFKVLNFEDTKIHNSSELKTSIIKIIREYKPEIVLGHWPFDSHPDIRGAAQATLDACFLAKLKSISTEQSPHSVRGVYMYEVWNPELTTSIEFEPDFLVDISDVMETKIEAAKCMKAVVDAEFGGDMEKWLDIFRPQNRYWGQKSGVKYAEPYREANINGIMKRAVQYLPF